MDDAREKRDALKGTVDVALKTAAIGILEGDSKVLQDVYGVINAVMIPDLKVIHAELSKTREYKEKKDLEKAFRELKDWLLAGTSAKIQAPKVQHLAHLKHRHPGICRWILGAPEYETWRDQKRPSLRHLFGEGCYGKSYLVSSIVEDLKRHLSQQIRSKSQLAYLFCKSRDNATQYCLTIMLHLVARLFTACGDEANNGNDSLPGEGVKYQTLIDVLKNARDKDEESRRKEGLVASANQLCTSANVS